MIGRYSFRKGHFRNDLTQHLSSNSTRLMSKNSDGELSPSVISRIRTGVKSDMSVSQLIAICNQTGVSPCDYFERLMF